jgi:magnesium transporter
MNVSSLPTDSRSPAELRQVVAEQLRLLIEQCNYEGAKSLLVPVPPVDVAEALESLPKTMQLVAFRLLPRGKAIEVYEYCTTEAQESLIGEFQDQDILDIVNGMAPDDRASLFDELPPQVVRRILPQLTPEERQATSQLLGYQPQTAGRLMTPEYIYLAEELTVAEATEDIYTMGAVRSEGSDNYFQANLLSVTRKRLPWLSLLLLTNTLTIFVMSNFEEILDQVVALAFFTPLLIDTGGNVGAQSSTVVIRGLSTDELKTRKPIWVIFRETMAGSLLGILLGLTVIALVYAFMGQPAIGLTVGISLVVIAVIAATTGAALPFLFHAMGFDPALMSAPFITTVVDILGIVVYLSIATVLLRL